jgi:hypothetical protein
VPGSFRPAAGIRRLHRNHNFAEPLFETALKSLRLSCGSELTRQGISLSSVTWKTWLGTRRAVISAGLPMSPWGSDCIFTPCRASGVQSLRIPGSPPAFPADCLRPSHCYSPGVARALHPFEGTGFPAHSQILLKLAALTLGPFLTLYLLLRYCPGRPGRPPSLKGTDYIISPRSPGEPDV